MNLNLPYGTRRFPAFILFILLFTSSHAQLPVYNWAKNFPKITWHANSANARTIGVDAAGNVYSAGRFEYTIDLDPGPAVYPVTATGQFSTGIYISKLDAAGNFVWGNQISALLDFSQLDLKVDAAGSVYIVTDTRAAVDLDPGPGVHIINPTGFRDLIIVKLNTNGDYVWGKQVGGPGDTGPSAYAIELDKDNNILIAGLFNNTVDFDPGAGLYNLTSSAHMKAFVMKLTNNGGFVWAKQFGNGPLVNSGSTIYDMESDANGNIVLTGGFSNTCDFDPGPSVYNLTSSNGSSNDAFICKLDADLNFIWVRTMGQGINPVYNGHIRPLGIDIDGQGNIVTTGFFIGNYDMDPGPATKIHNSIVYDCYLLKLGADGSFAWNNIISGSKEDYGHDVVVDAQNNVYLMGDFSPTVDLDPGPGTFVVTTPNYGAHALIKFTAGGNFVYGGTFPDLNNYTGGALFRRMVIDPAKNIYITGSGADFDFDPGPGTQTIVSDGGPFVLKLGPCLQPTASSLTVNKCDSYTLNGQTYDSSGTYIQTIPNSKGCDSVITLQLTINNKLTSRAISLCPGETFFAGAAIQTQAGIYYDTLQTSSGCDSVIVTNLTVNPKPVPALGADNGLCSGTTALLSPGIFAQYLWSDMSTSPTLTVSTAGSYWVKVSNEFNCSSTDSILVSTISAPGQFLKTSDSICNYQTLEIAPDRNFQEYQWSNGGTGRQVTINGPGTYWLRVTDMNGCKGRDSIVVYPKNCMMGVYFPGAFTPNKDGLNDVFKALVFGDLISFRLQVFNREGQLVFQTTDPNNGWDGSFKSLNYSTAALVWQCSYQLRNQAAQFKKGSIIVIR